MAVQRTDLYVGLFLIATAGFVVAALIATSGWGTERYDIYVQTTDAKDLAVDTKVFMQGLEVGRVAGISPRPDREGQRLEFVVRLSLLDRFPDGTPLRLPKNTVARVETALLGGSTLELSVDSARAVGGTLGPADTIRMERHAAAMEAFGSLANDLKGTIQNTLTAATTTLNSASRLADSLALTASTGRRFMAGIQPGTEKVLAGVSVNLERLRLVLDSANTRSGVTLEQVNALLAQSRTVMVSGDSLVRMLIAMGGENQPEIHAIIVNMRQISEQMQYVLEQLGRRPMRAITGVKIPDSLTVGGRARRDTTRAARDSASVRADTTRPAPAPAAVPAPTAPDSARAAPRDTTRVRPSGAPRPAPVPAPTNPRP